MVQGYCFKCAKKVEIVDPEYGINKIGRATAHGKCPVCKGKVHKLLKKEEIPASLESKLKKGKGRSRKSRKSRKSN